MIINRVEGKACKNTRSLWEEVFYEDSVKFTDYYFENKAEKNIGYVLGQAPYDAMMFRTPYLLQLGEYKKEISYIVGVATRKECRHRGYMKQLLMHSFKEMYEEKQPFAFLMPADPAIYEPFDFHYIYEREEWTLTEPESQIPWLESFVTEFGNDKKVSGTWKEESELRAAETDNTYTGNYMDLEGLYSVISLQRNFPQFQILERLAEFANSYLKELYNIYVHRDAAYYEMQLKESMAQNGDIYVLFEQGAIKAFFLYAREAGEVFIQEVMKAEEGCLDFLKKAEKKKPIIMARIIHLEEMLKLVRSEENRTVVIEIKDELIKENAGIYEWKMTSEGSQVTKTKELTAENHFVENERKLFSGKSHLKTEKPVISMHIGELAPKILANVFLNEIV